MQGESGDRELNKQTKQNKTIKKKQHPPPKKKRKEKEKEKEKQIDMVMMVKKEKKEVIGAIACHGRTLLKTKLKE